MAFKIKAPYTIDNTPVYRAEFKDPAVHGVTLNTGCIVINKNLPKDVEEQKKKKKKVHTDQIIMNEGDKNLPWEKEAYAKQKKL